MEENFSEFGKLKLIYQMSLQICFVNVVVVKFCFAYWYHFHIDLPEL